MLSKTNLKREDIRMTDKKVFINGTERLAFKNGQGFYRIVVDEKDIEWINHLSENIEIFNKAGYFAHKGIGVCKSLEKFNKDINTINKYYVHRKELCKRCKRLK